MTKPTAPISGLPSSPDLKARIVDFMERADELLGHELAEYKAPFQLSVTTDQGKVVDYELDYQLVDKEKLVYFATMERPILWVKDPIYVTKLVEAIRQEHPKLQPHCGRINTLFKHWQKRVFIGTKTGVIDRGTQQLAPPDEDWKLTNVWTAPAGTPFPDDEMADAPLVADMYYANIYLNGFVWHSDSEKTAEYRAAKPVEQLHYRKCADLRVFSGLQMVIKPIHDFFVDARTVGEDF